MGEENFGLTVDGEIDPDVVTIFTDGSCYPNPNGKGGWGFVALYRDIVREGSGHLPRTTTNVAELTAVREALRVTKVDAPPILIITDSQYTFRSFSLWRTLWEKHDWRNSVGDEIANRKLIMEIIELIDARQRVEFRWMKGHQKGSSPWVNFNNWADRLAGEARKND